MFNLNDIKDFNVTRNRITIPQNEDNKVGYGNLIFLNTPNINSNAPIINDSIINFLNYKYIFKDNNFRTKIFNKSFSMNYTKERNEDYKIYKEILKKVQPINTIATANGRNLFIDFSYYTKTFFNFHKSVVKTVYEGYIQMIDEITSNKTYDIYGYTDKYIVTDVSQWYSESNPLKNPISILYLTMMKDIGVLKGLGNITFIFINGDRGLFKFKANNLAKSAHMQFKQNLIKLHPEAIKDNLDELKDKSTIDDEVTQSKKIEIIKKEILKTDSEENDAMVDVIYNKMGEIKDTDNDLSDQEMIERIKNDADLMNELETIRTNGDTKSVINKKRNEKLIEEQKKVQFEGQTIEDILNQPRIGKIEELDISDKVNTPNVNVTKIKFTNFEKSYNKQNYKQDTLSCFTALSQKKDLPVYIRKIETRDHSDSMNQLETITVHMEDANRVRHTITVDVPKFIDGHYMYLQGNKKELVHQKFLKPVVKIRPDTVQVCTNYKKIFMYRYGKSVSPKIEVFKKFIKKHAEDFNITYGNGSRESGKYRTSIEYDDISKFIVSLKIKKSKCIFIFSQKKIDEMLKLGQYKHNKEVDKKLIRIGFDAKNNLITVNPDPSTDDHIIDDIIDKIVDELNRVKGENYYEELAKELSFGKRFIYTRCKIMCKFVPTVVLLGYYEGISTVLKKAGIEHYFTDKRIHYDNINEGLVEFSDGYLIYKRNPIENSLLMNGLSGLPTKLYKYEDFDTKDPYLDIFDALYGQRIIASGLDAFYDNMIDPITYSILETLKLPTDFVSLMIYANSLLVHNEYTEETDLASYRIRSNEIVPALLYGIVSDAYSRYKRTSTNRNPVKISVPRNALIKELMEQNILENVSVLNPIMEMEKTRAVTAKGPSGINLSQAYSKKVRSFNRSMTGVMGLSTSPDANCGVVRKLTFEPTIESTRGFIDENDDYSKLKDVNLFTPAELLSPIGVLHDDSIRTAMAAKQSLHIMPVNDSNPVLISNGLEYTLPYNITSDFSVVAKGKGKVKEINNDTNIMVVEYDNPPKGEDKFQMINLAPEVVKNGAGGFYLSNRLTTDLKVGQKFDDKDILAYNEKFFSRYNDGVKFNVGTLAKVACTSTYCTYEDSNIVTHKLSNRCGSDVVMEKKVVLHPTANVDYICKIGDKVEVGDELVRFEQSKVDDSINKLLADIGDEMKEEVTAMGKSVLRSKYSGVIEDIKIYCTADLDELSPSLKKIVGNYYKHIKERKNIARKYNIQKAENTGETYRESDTKMVPINGKVLGEELESGILIRIFIKYRDLLAVGDKIIDFAALKTVIGEVVDEGYEPFSEFRSDEEVSSMIPPISIYARMVSSILLTMFGNKLLVELRRQLCDIWTDGKYDYTHDFDY